VKLGVEASSEYEVARGIIEYLADQITYSSETV